MTIWKKAAVAGLFVGMGFGQPLYWKGLQTCVIDNGYMTTPLPHRAVPHTAYFDKNSFEGVKEFEDIDAFDHDGSQSETMRGTQRQYGLFLQQMGRTGLLLREGNLSIIIDHVQRIYESHASGAMASHYWEEDDSQCSHAAAHYAYLSGRLPDSVVAGVPVVGYRGKDYMGSDYEVYFAPSIGCQEMRFDMFKRGFLGWKTSECEKVVDSYELGPPDSSLFRVPAGYKQVPSILAP